MATRKTSGININDFFGLSKKYMVCAVKSDLGLYPFILQLRKCCHVDFSFLGTFKPDIPKYGAHFLMMYSITSDAEKMNVVVLENKTSHFNEAEKIHSKTERNLNFQTLSLFDDFLYIFNSQGKFLFKSDFPDYDYLILIYTAKEQDFTSFTSQLSYYKSLKLVYNSKVPVNSSNKLEMSKIAFLKELFCSVEMNISEFKNQIDNRLLSKRKSIPFINLTNQSRIELSRVMNTKYVDLLNKDISFD
jgi:hypothetical protein